MSDYRGFYMGARDLLNLLNTLGKRDNMQGSVEHSIAFLQLV